MNSVLSRNAPGIDKTIDPRAAQTRRPWTYASADYAVAGNALQIVGEELCESVNLCQDQRVLDVSAGNFTASLAAARRWCDVTTTDQGSDLTRSRQRVEAESLGVRFVSGDAEGLPFADQSFDAVLSSFGAMFATDQERAASEMIRVCRRGRQVGLANWTPDGFIGRLFALISDHVPQAPGAIASCKWGTQERLAKLFGAYGNVWWSRKHVALRSRAPADWVDKLRASYLPVAKAFALLDAEGKRALRSDLLELVAKFNRAADGTMHVEAKYLEVVITRR